MQIALASAPGVPGAVNLDWAGAGTGGVAVVLDGLTEAGPTGCRHGTAWYVRQLGARLLAAAGEPDRPLADALATALIGVADAHRDTCDLTHPGSPGATVAVVRPRPPDRDGAAAVPVEYLVLADAVVVLDTTGTGSAAPPAVLTDERVEEHLADLRAHAAGPAEAGPAETGPAVAGPANTDPTRTAHPADAALRRLIEAQQRLRNTPGGYWVARADPDAAAQAVTGALPGVRSALLLSDGAALLASQFGALSWRELIDLAAGHGPHAVIAATRELEARDPGRTVWPRYKAHDDATAVFCAWSMSERG